MKFNFLVSGVLSIFDDVPIINKFEGICFKEIHRRKKEMYYAADGWGLAIVTKISRKNKKHFSLYNLYQIPT